MRNTNANWISKRKILEQLDRDLESSIKVFQNEVINARSLNQMRIAMVLHILRMTTIRRK